MRQQRHIGVYAFILHGDLILLIKKSRGPYRGKWDLPGGGLEFGESASDGLVREVLEETGLKIKKYDLQNVLTHTTISENSDGEQEELYHIGIIYSVALHATGEKLKTGPDGQDSEGARWLKLSEIDERNASPFTVQIIRNLKRFQL